MNDHMMNIDNTIAWSVNMSKTC